MDIFLSYSSKDRGRIESLVQALEGQGWSVFWDRQHILPGEAFGPACAGLLRLSFTSEPEVIREGVGRIAAFLLASPQRGR